MKKIYAIAAVAASVLAISSCSKEIAPVSAPEKAGSDGLLVEKTFYASTDATKANIDGLSILWAAGDCIGVSAGTEVQKFSISGGSNTGTASFTGSVAEAEKYYAIYPYNKPGSSTANAMTTPGVFTTQFNNWYGSLKPNSLLHTPACAVSTDGDSFRFKNFGAILKFTVPSELASKLTKLEIGSSVSSEKLFGAVTVDLTGTNPVVSTASSTLCTLSQTFSAGSYYIACAPITLSNGFYMRISFNDGSNYYAYRGVGGSIALQANKIYDLGTVSDSDEIVLSEFNNGVISCATTCGFNASCVDCSTVTESASGKCMKYSVKGTGAGSGQVSFDMSVSKVDACRVFPTKLRKPYTKTRIRVYLGELDWYPTIKYSGTTYFRLPSSVNGVSLAAYCGKNCTNLTDTEVESLKALWATAIKTDDWNEIEWDFTDWLSDLNWSANAYLNFFFSTTPKGESSSLKYNETIYLDNIRFAVSDANRKNLIAI